MTSKPQWTLAHISTLPLNQSLDRDWSYEIKFLRRKATTNLDSVLKSRDITLLTKVHIVKAMLFPVVMYRCEIWTIKKAESQRIDTFKLWCWRRLFRVPLDCKIKPVNPKASQFWILLEDWCWSSNPLPTWCECWEGEYTRSRRQQRMRCLDTITDSMDMNQWTWTNSRREWRKGEPGVLQSMGLQSWTWLCNWKTTTE